MSPLVAIFDKVKFNCFCGVASKRDKSKSEAEFEPEPESDVSVRPPANRENSSDEPEPKSVRLKVKKARKKGNHKYDGKHKYTIYDEVSTIAERYDITILPVHADFRIDNLYPETNQVHKWNIIIIGKDKTFIHASIHDLDFPDFESFPNRRSGNVLDRQLQDFFDPIFDKTLNNEKLQFIMCWSKKIYLVNTYPLANQISDVIGGVIFIRDYSLMPKMTFASRIGERRKSNDAIIQPNVSVL